VIASKAGITVGEKHLNPAEIFLSISQRPARYETNLRSSLWFFLTLLTPLAKNISTSQPRCS
jgi:hypothetical protein